MINKIIIIISLFNLSILRCQSIHVLSIGTGGVSNGATFHDRWNTEFTLSYSITYKALIVNVHGLVLPKTNYGVQTKQYFGVGFATPVDKIISFYLLNGFATAQVTKSKYNYLASDGNSVQFTSIYSNDIMPFLSIGLNFKPIKRKPILLGLIFDISKERTYIMTSNFGAKEPFYSTYYPISIGGTIKYFFTKKQ